MAYDNQEIKRLTAENERLRAVIREQFSFEPPYDGDDGWDGVGHSINMSAECRETIIDVLSEEQEQEG